MKKSIFLILGLGFISLGYCVINAATNNGTAYGIFYSENDTVSTADSVVAESLVTDNAEQDTTATNAETDIEATGDTTTVATAALAADSVVAINDTIQQTEDSASTVAIADSATVANDTLQQANDTTAIAAIADSAIVANDTLQQVNDSLRAKMDSLTAIRDSIMNDSIARVNDSIKAVNDSLAAVKFKMQQDSLKMAQRLTKDTLKKKIVWKYLRPYKRSEEECRLLKAFYKKNITDGLKDSAAYEKAFTPWMEAFNGMSDRTLDMYIDGVGILVTKIKGDTTRADYESMRVDREILMELYEHAILDIHKINSQIDRSRSTDTLTIPKLRAQQISYYTNLWYADSAYNRSHHKFIDQTAAKDEAMKDSAKANTAYWKEVMFKDSIECYRLYRMYKDICYGGDVDINPAHMSDFVAVCNAKTWHDINRYCIQVDSTTKNYYNLPALEAIVQKDHEQALALMEKIAFAAVTDREKSNEELRRATIDKDFKGIYEAFKKRESSRPMNEEEMQKHFEELEIYYNDLIASGDADVWDKILDSDLRRNQKSDVYLNALRTKYDNFDEAYWTFDVAKDIARRALSQEKYGDAIKYYEECKMHEEFFNCSNYEQSEIYFRIALITYTSINAKKGGRISDMYKNVIEAINACPEYPDPYFLYGQVAMMQNGRLSDKARNTIDGRFLFCVAYDKFATGLSKLRELPADSEMRTAFKEEQYQKSMAAAQRNWPTQTMLFSAGRQGEVGKAKNVSLGGITFSGTLRVLNE